MKKSRKIGLLYAFFVPLFSLMYFIASSCFGEIFYINGTESELDIIDSFYFSVITFTTLGYGDIYPAGGVGKLLVSFQVLSGILLLGLFLNGLSLDRNNEFSKLEKQKDQEKELKQRNRLRKVLEQHVLLLFDVFTSPGPFRWDMHAKNARSFDVLEEDIKDAMALVRKGGGNKFGVVNVACLLSTSDQQYDTMVSLNSVAALVSNECLEVWTSWVSNVRYLKQEYEKASKLQEGKRKENDVIGCWPTLNDLTSQLEELIKNGLEIIEGLDVLD